MTTEHACERCGKEINVMGRSIDGGLHPGKACDGQFRLEIAAANMARCDPEFRPTLAAAKRRKRELRDSGYSVTIMRKTATGLELI